MSHPRSTLRNQQKDPNRLDWVNEVTSYMEAHFESLKQEQIKNREEQDLNQEEHHVNQEELDRPPSPCDSSSTCPSSCDIVEGFIANALVNIHETLEDLVAQVDNCTRNIEHLKDIVFSDDGKHVSRQPSLENRPGREDNHLHLDPSLTNFDESEPCVPPNSPSSLWSQHEQQVEARQPPQFEPLDGQRDQFRNHGRHTAQSEPQPQHHQHDQSRQPISNTQRENGYQITIKHNYHSDTQARLTLDLALYPIKIEFTNSPGRSGQFEYHTTSKDTVLSIEDALTTYLLTHPNVQKQISFCVDVLSPFALKTEIFPQSIFLHLPFVRNGRIKQREAQEHIVINNPDYFRHAGHSDIYWVDVLKLNHDAGPRVAVNVKVKQAVINRVKSNPNGRKLHLAGREHMVKIITRSNACYRCLQRGHKGDECPAPLPRCKHCHEPHESWECTKVKQRRCKHCKKPRQICICPRLARPKIEHNQ